MEFKEKKDNKRAKGSKLKALEISTPFDGDDTEDEGLPESDGEGEARLRFKCWKGVDVNYPTFSVGLVFPTVEKLRQAITKYGVKTR